MNTHPDTPTEDMKTSPSLVGDEPFELSLPPRPDPSALVIDVEGFEGPLDLLLSLAREQKVDLTKISILALAEQYLAFIEEARAYRLEVAADYLVMAAWLAYLKSRLLIPDEPSDDGEPSGQELAEVLQFRLRRLEAMREAARKLMNSNRLGRDVFARGDPEPMALETKSAWTASMFDLLSAYAAQRQRNTVATVQLQKRTVWSQAEAREILVRLIGEAASWTPMSVLISEYVTGENRATALASSFSASLELAREGQLKLQQSKPFSPLMMRAATAQERRDARAASPDTSVEHKQSEEVRPDED